MKGCSCGAMISSPSTAPSTEMAGVIIPSPYTTPIAPITSGAIRLCVPAAALIVGFGAAEEKAASDAVAAVADVRSDDPRVFAAAREADVELLQLSVQMRAFEPGLVGDAA